MLFLRYPQLRRLLQLAIPTAVAADTVRSIYVTYDLAQQRFVVSGWWVSCGVGEPGGQQSLLGTPPSPTHLPPSIPPPACLQTGVGGGGPR